MRAAMAAPGLQPASSSGLPNTPALLKQAAESSATAAPAHERVGRGARAGAAEVTAGRG